MYIDKHFIIFCLFIIMGRNTLLGKLFEEHKPKFSSHQWEYGCMFLYDKIDTYPDIINYLNSGNENYITFILDYIIPLVLNYDGLNDREKENLSKHLVRFHNDLRFAYLNGSYSRNGEESELKSIGYYARKLSDMLK